MKRHISIALFLAILASLTACGGTESGGVMTQPLLPATIPPLRW